MRSPWQSDPFAGMDQQIRQRESDQDGTVPFRTFGQFRTKMHGRREIDPQPMGSGAFPFSFAHIEAVITGGAPPVDPAG